MNPAEPQAGQRFVFIDALRGLAAMAVVFYHMAINAEVPHGGHSGWLSEIYWFGAFGVEVFFVLSGFVIAHSIRGGAHTPAFLLRFGVRRSVRLDPPYWLVIVLEIAAIWLGMRLIGLDNTLPSLERVLYHLVYLQGVLDVGQILPVFWTLCYEVQFYLVLVAAMVCRRYAQRSSKRAAASLDKIGLLCGMAVFLFSIAMYQHFIDTPVKGLFIDRWFQFFLGVAAYHAAKSVWLRNYFFALLFISVAVSVLSDTTAYRLQSTGVVTCTAALIYAAMAMQGLHTWLQNRFVQFLGRISYSLYLIHLVVGWRAISAAKLVLGAPASAAATAGLFALGVVASIASAWVLCLLVERPAQRLAKRVSLGQAIGEAPRKVEARYPGSLSPHQ